MWCGLLRMFTWALWHHKQLNVYFTNRIQTTLQVHMAPDLMSLAGQTGLNSHKLATITHNHALLITEQCFASKNGQDDKPDRRNAECIFNFWSVRKESPLDLLQSLPSKLNWVPWFKSAWLCQLCYQALVWSAETFHSHSYHSPLKAHAILLRAFQPLTWPLRLSSPIFDQRFCGRRRKALHRGTGGRADVAHETWKAKLEIPWTVVLQQASVLTDLFDSAEANQQETIFIDTSESRALPAHHI